MTPQVGRANANDVYEANPLGAQEHECERNGEQRDPDVPIAESAAPDPIQQSPTAPRNLALQPETATQDAVELLEPMQSEPKRDSAELLKLGLEDTNKFLVDIRAGLKDMKQVLVATQQSMARGLNMTNHKSGSQFLHTLVNAEGEEPHYNLARGNPVQDSDIAQYLRFYGIGGEFIHAEDQQTIKEGERARAITTLRSYLGI
ncbi:hypothetical protein FRC10_007263 [Ceratobasidium sp. 414]|nr:hypothetical protein FRC10_007263 [Ceratobasidium sp. 414]